MSEMSEQITKAPEATESSAQIPPSSISMPNMLDETVPVFQMNQQTSLSEPKNHLDFLIQ